MMEGATRGRARTEAPPLQSVPNRQLRWDGWTDGHWQGPGEGNEEGLVMETVSLLGVGDEDVPELNRVAVVQTCE